MTKGRREKGGWRSPANKPRLAHIHAADGCSARVPIWWISVRNFGPGRRADLNETESENFSAYQGCRIFSADKHQRSSSLSSSLSSSRHWHSNTQRSSGFFPPRWRRERRGEKGEGREREKERKEGWEVKRGGERRSKEQRERRKEERRKAKVVSLAEEQGGVGTRERGGAWLAPISDLEGKKWRNLRRFLRSS